MFGYVRPVRPELREEDLQRYRAAYCGVCRALGKRYGLSSRFLVNYDVTFLYFLLSSVNEPCAVKRCFCPARIVCRKPCIDDEKLLSYVAAVDVILCRNKLLDDIQDAGFLKRIPYRLAKLLTARAYRKAKKELPDFDEKVRRELGRLRKLEQTRSCSIDATADSFASLLAACASVFEEDAIRRPTEQVLYHVGRFIYLADALDDLAEDCKKDNYNPLRYRFAAENGALREEDLTYFGQIVNASVNLAGAAFELLPVCSGREILENIIYLGLPAVFAAVRSGEFRAKNRTIFRRRAKYKAPRQKGAYDERSL